MSHKASVTLSSKGQLTLPASLRKLWNLKAGDQIDLEFEEGRAVMIKRVRRSILEARKDLQPLSLGRPLTQQDIDGAVASEMIEQEIRIRKYAKWSASKTTSFCVCSISQTRSAGLHFGFGVFSGLRFGSCQ